MVHSYYTGVRAFMLSVSVLQTVLFALQIYWDRRRYSELIHPKPRTDGKKAKSKHVFRWPTKSVVRVLGLVISVMVVVLSVDSRGAFGIYSNVALHVITTIASFLTMSMLGFSFYRSVLAAFPTQMIELRHLRRRLRIATLSYVVGYTALQLLSEVVTDMVGCLVISILLLVGLALFLVALVIVIRELRRLGKFFELNPAQASDYGTNAHKQILDKVKKWKHFALAVVVLWMCLTLITAFDTHATFGPTSGAEGEDAGGGNAAATGGEQLTRRERFVADPDSAPPLGVFDPRTLESVFARCMIGVALWYTWISRTRAKADADEAEEERSVCSDDTVLTNANRKRANSSTITRTRSPSNGGGPSCLRTMESSCRALESISRAPSPSRSTMYRKTVNRLSNTYTETTSCRSVSPDFSRHAPISSPNTPIPDNVNSLSQIDTASNTMNTTATSDRPSVIAHPISRRKLFMPFAARYSESSNCLALDGLGRVSSISYPGTPVSHRVPEDIALVLQRDADEDIFSKDVDESERERRDSHCALANTLEDAAASITDDERERERGESNTSAPDSLTSDESRRCRSASRSASLSVTITLSDDEGLIGSLPSISSGIGISV